MNFYTEITPFIEYLNSIRKLENYLSFDMKFPLKWGIPKSLLDESQIVAYETGVENTKGLSFVSKIEDSEINNTIGKIMKVIKLNKEREIKDKLFKETVERLKTTFEKTDLEKLQKLYFDFESDYDPNTLEISENGQETTNAELA
jgi:hypothetical protein